MSASRGYQLNAVCGWLNEIQPKQWLALCLGLAYGCVSSVSCAANGCMQYSACSAIAAA